MLAFGQRKSFDLAYTKRSDGWPLLGRCLLAADDCDVYMLTMDISVLDK
jgi:hypothetical protein